MNEKNIREERKVYAVDFTKCKTVYELCELLNMLEIEFSGYVEDQKYIDLEAYLVEEK